MTYFNILMLTQLRKSEGDFLLIDQRTWELRERKSNTKEREFAQFGGDFCMQTRHNVMISCEWGHPRVMRSGLAIDEPSLAMCGSSLNIWRISPGHLKQTLMLNETDGCMTTTCRLLHNPECHHAFACSALGGSIYHLHMDTLSERFRADLVIQLPPIPVDGWTASELPALITDIVISLDDRFLFVAAWLHGIVAQYDIQDPGRVSLVSKVHLGGLLTTTSGITPCTGSKAILRAPVVVCGKEVRGGPASLQLSMDGKRLYVCTSFYSPLDQQFYPDMANDGGQMLLIDVSSNLEINEKFLVEMDGYSPRSVHLENGDATSDNFL